MTSTDKVMLSVFSNVVGDVTLISQANVQYRFLVHNVGVIVHLAADTLLDLDIPHQVTLDDIFTLQAEYGGIISYSLV